MEIDGEAALSLHCCRAWPWPECLVRLFGIFVRCLGFYYDISAITMVRASERDTNRHIGREGRRGQDQDIDFLVDKSPESLAWIWATGDS